MLATIKCILELNYKTKSIKHLSNYPIWLHTQTILWMSNKVKKCVLNFQT